MAQFARPDSDVTNTGTNGFAAIDEATASDADFWWGDNNVAEELEVGLTNVTDPTSSSAHTFRYRIAKTNAGTVDGGGNAVTVAARLMQGVTEIGRDLVEPVKTATGTWTQYEYTLSAAEADAITDYTDLRLEFVTSASGGSPANRRGGAVSWAELQVPDVAALVLTPGTASLALTAQTPTVTASDHKSVTPGLATLSLTAFAPTVTVAAAGVTVTPGTASLALTAFAPTVQTPRLVTPGIGSLTLTAFAPTVTATAHVTVTPGTASLTLTAFAPTATGGAGLTLTPGAASLSLTAFAPSVTATANITVTPGLATLLLSGFAPVVTASDHKSVTPGVAGLSLTGFAPMVTASDHQTVTPGTASVVLTAFTPTVTAGGVPEVNAGRGPSIRAVHSALPRISVVTGRHDKPSLHP